MHSNKCDLCHSIISEIWAWDEDKNIWNTASSIPGKVNCDDAESHKKQTEPKWMLNQKRFTKIISKFQSQSEIDLFASRLMFNYQCLFRTILTQRLCILMLFQYHVIPWQGRPFHSLPPSTVIRTALHKIVLDVTTEITVVPN